MDLGKIISQTLEWISHSSDSYSVSSKSKISDSQLEIINQYALDLGPGSQKTILQMVASFYEDLVMLMFRVPNLSHPTLKKNQLVAVFIGFLLQLLHLAENDHVFSNSSNLMVELRSLLAILGDTPFQATQHQDLRGLIAEFEDVANEAGTILYSAFFSPNPPPMELIEDKLVVFSTHVRGLKSDVIHFLNLLPETKFSVDLFFSLDSLMCGLEDMLRQDENLPFDVKNLITMLHRQLKGFQSLVRDIDLSKFPKNEGLGEVVSRIKQAAFEAEYVIKSFMVGDAPSWYLTVRLAHLIERIKNIGADTRLLEAKKDYDVGAIKDATVSAARPLLHANRDIEVDDIMPLFEKQELDILDQLVRGTKQLQCISILGMGGIGKTTLAKKLYNHSLVCSRFDRRLWCTVSQKFEMRNLLLSILTSLGEIGNATNFSDWDDAKLVQRVYQSLFDRRFLIVVDDIWHRDHYDCLQRSFPDNENGSRILLTTRNLDVAPVEILIHRLPLLSDDQCLQLLKKNTVRNCEPHPPHQEEIEKKIVGKCHGLPLAVVVLAGMLSSADNEKSVLEMIDGSIDNSVHFDELASITQILKLSYENLPPYLKPCFLYLGVFLEDENISIQKLKRLWIAEGFLLKDENARVEDAAEQYVNELIGRNLIIVSETRSDGGAKFCVVHDLLLDLCLTIGRRENFLARVDNDNSIMYYQNHPHLCADTVDTDYLPCGLHVRSLFFPHWSMTSYVFNVKLLRTLECSKAIGVKFLLYLRYLSTGFVPKSIHRNANLEFLVASEACTVLTPEILKMSKLRHIRGCEIQFSSDCEAIQTNNLEYLATVHVRNKKDVEMLRCSPHLRTLKCVYASSKEKTTYRCIDFQFLAQCESLRLDSLIVMMTDEMKLPSSIKKLNLRNLMFPWKEMSVVAALPHLEVLKLGCDAFKGEIWDTGDDEFPRLRYLKMDDLDFSEWLVESNQQFPSLQQLVLKDCRNLKEIPSEIGEVAALRGIEVSGCQTSLVESAKRIQEEQREMGTDDLKLILDQVIKLKLTRYRADSTFRRRKFPSTRWRARPPPIFFF